MLKAQVYDSSFAGSAINELGILIYSFVPTPCCKDREIYSQVVNGMAWF